MLFCAKEPVSRKTEQCRRFLDKVDFALCVLFRSLLMSYCATQAASLANRQVTSYWLLEADAFIRTCMVFLHTCALTPSNQHCTTTDTTAISR